MAMNKKLFNRIVKLHDDGADIQVVIKLLIDLGKNSGDSAEAIEQFYTSNYPIPNGTTNSTKAIRRLYNDPTPE